MSKDLDFHGERRGEKWRNNDILKLERTWGPGWSMNSQKLQLLGHGQETKGVKWVRKIEMVGKNQIPLFILLVLNFPFLCLSHRKKSFFPDENG